MAKLDSINYKGTLQEIVPEIAPLFKTTEAYSAGDHVIHDAQWYTFKEDKAAGAWDDTKVDGPFTVSEKISELKEDLTLIIPSANVPDSAVLTGYYYSASVGSAYELVQNVSSKYIAPIDVSAYVGGQLKVSLSAVNASGTRKWGFCNSEGIVKAVYVENSGGFVLDQATNKYVMTVPIVDTHFFFSYNNQYTFTIEYSKKDYVSSEVFESRVSPIEVWTDISDDDTEALNLTYRLASNNIRIVTSETPLNKLIKSVIITGVPSGFEVAFMRTSSPTAGTSSSWVANGYTFIRKHNDPHNHFAMQFRKNDNGTITTEEKDTLASAVTVTVIYNNLINYIESDSSTCYVSTDGDDTNDGRTRSTAIASIQRAIDSGFKNILVKAGTYSPFAIADVDNVFIGLDRYYGTFDASTANTPFKIVIDGNNTASNGISIQRCNSCKFSDIEVKNCTENGVYINRCTALSFDACVVHDIAVGQNSGGGYVMTYTDAEFVSCGAYNIGVTQASTSTDKHIDGFNMHSGGATYCRDCWAYNCYDDGISHHDACTGVIDGGEWYGCGKGGIASPTHGAVVDVKNAYSHNNGYGIYAYSDNDFDRSKAINITNCVCKDNSVLDIGVGEHYDANVWNCIYSTISSGSNVNILT